MERRFEHRSVSRVGGVDGAQSVGSRVAIDVRLPGHPDSSRDRDGIRRRRQRRDRLAHPRRGTERPAPELRRFLPILWAGFWLNAVSGVLLLIGYPTKALTNPVFYLKLTLIAVAMVLLVRISRQVFETGSGASLSPLDPLDPPISSRLRNLAIASLICWSGSITAGRLLAYTYHRLTQLH